MNPLPFDRQKWAFARIVTSDAFRLGVGPWQVQPMWSRRRKGYGFELLDCTRAALPAIGEATFQYRFGLIDGDVVGVSDAANTTRRAAGNPWDPATDAATAPDLRGYEVRIQLAPAAAPGETPAWFTAWWGQVEYQEDTVWPGAKYPAGVRTYRCVDGFARAKRWPMDRHSIYTGEWYVDVEGHPGYNVGPDGRVVGNKGDVGLVSAPSSAVVNPALTELVSIADAGYKFHAFQGEAIATSFTVQEALEDAVRKRRGLGEPVFSFYGDTDLVGDAISVPVREGDSAWDVVARTCRRERGRGLVFVDWADDTSNPVGTLAPRLTIRPQTRDDIPWTSPVSAGGTIKGAANTSGGRTATTKTVDLIGDHRILADQTKLGDKFLHVADAVETSSELIQLLVTLSYYDGTDFTLSKRWNAGREAAFSALTGTARSDEAWMPLWQLHGLPVAWAGTAKDHNGGTTYACDFGCNDSGELVSSQTSGRSITSPLLCRILPDLPLYEGYDYATSTPLRKIGSQSGYDEDGQPSRRPLLPLIRTDSDRYLTGDELVGGSRTLTVQIRGRDVLVYSSSDRANGLRVIGDTATSGLGSIYDLDAFGITVGLELPHRIRRRTVRQVGSTDVEVRRIVTIRLPDLHLWLAHSGAIWDVDTSGRNSSGSAGKRGAGGAAAALPGLLRDDRDALSRIHAMACAWYLEPRQTGSWTLRACGMLPSFATGLDASETITYPKMGDLITDFSAAGQIATFNTPVTSVTYDHTTGRTTWETDWQELDTV